MSRLRMKPIKPTERDATGVVIPAGAFDSLMANDAAWRALLRLPVGYTIKRVADGWVILNDADEIVIEWATLDVALQEVVEYDE